MLPASTFGLVTVDLDPSGGQKVEAIKTLRKFPSFRDQVGLKPDSDPLKRLFDEAQKDGNCKDLDYERDVKSWIGQRLGFGGVEVDGKARPVAALQVSDADNAKTGFPRLAKCLEMSDYGWTLTDDYIVISDSTALAKQIVAAGKKAPLSENADFQKWTDEAGGAGIMNAYVGRKAVDVMSEELSSGSGDLGGLVDGSGGSDDEQQFADILAGYKDFQGAGAVLRFADGGIELSMAGSGGKATRTKATVADHVSAMPADTACCWRSRSRRAPSTRSRRPTPTGQARSSSGACSASTSRRTSRPCSASPSASASAVTLRTTSTSINEPSDVSVGALIHGDSAEHRRRDRQAREGARCDRSPTCRSPRRARTARSSWPATSSTPTSCSARASSPTTRASRTPYPTPTTPRWSATSTSTASGARPCSRPIRDEGGADDKEVADNLAVLRALGISAWTEDDVSHGLVRLSLK